MSQIKTAAALAEELRLQSDLRKLLRDVTDAEARRSLGVKVGIAINGKPATIDYSGIAFSGYDFRGAARGVYQVRLTTPPLKENGEPEGKYRSRPNKAGRWINTTPGKLTPRDIPVRCESVKSVLAIAASAARVGRRHIKPFDTNGLSGWLAHDDKTRASDPLPDLMLLAGLPLWDAPDSNVNPTRAKLVAQMVTFHEYMLDVVRVGSLRRIVIPPESDVNGPDDYIVKYGDEAWWRLFDAARETWTEAFPAVADFGEKELKTELLIEHIIAAETVTVLASPSENYKTMLALSLCAALLSGERAFGSFKVARRVKGILYCCPDMSQNLLIRYARYFSLDNLPTFRIRTMAQGDVLGPGHRYLREAARAGYYIVLDTMNYFTGADDDNNPLQLNKFIMSCRTLIGAQGSPGIMLLSHPTKSGARASEVEVTEWVAGTYAKIGSVDTIFCVKKILAADGITPVKVWVSRVKSRPFDGVPCPAFTIGLVDGQGSCIERGELKVLERNAGPLSVHLNTVTAKPGRKENPDTPAKLKFIASLLAGCNGNAPSAADIKKELDAQFPDSPSSERSVYKWLPKAREQAKLGTLLEQKAMGGGKVE